MRGSTVPGYGKFHLPMIIKPLVDDHPSWTTTPVLRPLQSDFEDGRKRGVLLYCRGRFVNDGDWTGVAARQVSSPTAARNVTRRRHTSLTGLYGLSLLWFDSYCHPVRIYTRSIPRDVGNMGQTNLTKIRSDFGGIRLQDLSIERPRDAPTHSVPYFTYIFYLCLIACPNHWLL